MATEYEVINYIKGIGDYVAESTLVNFGASNAVLSSVKNNNDIILYNFADTNISDGLSLNLFDASNYVYVDDASWLKPVLNFSIRCKIKLYDYTTASNQTFISKYNGFTFRINASNEYELKIYDGSTDVLYQSTAANTLSNNTTYWLRADWEYENGTGSSQTTFFYSESLENDSSAVDDWEEIEQVTNTQHPISHSTSSLYVGGLSTAGEVSAGVLYAVELIDEDENLMIFDFSNQAEILLYNKSLQDYYSNNLHIIGNKNYLLQNINSSLWYKYEGI